MKVIYEKNGSAVLRGLEIIGEATKNISKDLKAKYPNIPWKDIAGMRDKLIHCQNYQASQQKKTKDCC